MRTLPVSFLLACCLQALAPNAAAGAKNGTLDIYWIDSQGGGSTLIVTPADESILIDSGNPGGRDSGRIHTVAKQVAGLDHIDHLIVTHLHVDHYGGAPELAALMPIRHLHDNGVTDKDPDGGNDASWPLRIKGYREMPVGDRTVVKPGATLKLQPGAKDSATPSLRFLAAKKRMAVSTAGATNIRDCSDPKPKPVDNSDNANSIVSLLEYGRFRYFNGGDLTWNVEAKMTCPVVQTGPVDVYQVNHHGLDISNNPLLLTALAPTVAVFNNGPRKGCMPAVVSNLRQLPSLKAIYQVHVNQQNPEVNAPAEHCANKDETGGNYLLLQVAPGGKEYTVTVPSTGHSQQFQSRQ